MPLRLLPGWVGLRYTESGPIPSIGKIWLRGARPTAKRLRLQARRPRRRKVLPQTIPERARGGESRSAPIRAERLRKRRRSEEHTSELQSLMRISYAVFCLKKKTKQ